MRYWIMAAAAGGLGGLLAVGVLVPRVFGTAAGVDAPRKRMPAVATPTDHTHLFEQAFAPGDGPAVTRACLECHPHAAEQVMKTSHWTWAGQKVKLPGRHEVMRVGKRNLINNFCIHAGPNIAECSSCHAGYGWLDNHYDFSRQDHVDCLVCHDQTGQYQKGLGGNPKKDVDLLACAQSVGRPTRSNCGQCHFRGGGGNAVKHGDMDGSMYFPTQRIDVHMGKLDLACVDCHRTRDHQIPGCAMSVCIDRPKRVHCTDCHSERPHADDRLDAHTATVACQTCHIPKMAIDAPTKMF